MGLTHWVFSLFVHYHISVFLCKRLLEVVFALQRYLSCILVWWQCAWTTNWKFLILSWSKTALALVLCCPKSAWNHSSTWSQHYIVGQSSYSISHGSCWGQNLQKSVVLGVKCHCRFVVTSMAASVTCIKCIRSAGSLVIGHTCSLSVLFGSFLGYVEEFVFCGKKRKRWNWWRKRIAFVSNSFEVSYTFVYPLQCFLKAVILLIQIV